MSALLDVQVVTETTAWTDAIADAGEVCRRAARAAFAAAGEGGEACEVCLLLADDDRMRELNRSFRGYDRPTNVLSFASQTPADRTPRRPGEGALTLGDIAVAFETVAGEADDQGKPIADHLSHMVVHGMLHLFGFDHQTDPDADRMERLEVEILAGLGVADPYLPADPIGP